MNVMTPSPTPVGMTPAPTIAIYDARDLIKTGAQACILLDNQTYYLRITRAGKLILTK